MRFAKCVLLTAITAPLLMGVSGCASKFIGTREGVDRVSLADANQVAACQSKGTFNYSIFAKAGVITRAENEVEANLYQMARNNAVDVGADTVVKGESKEFGSRTFSLYKCRP